MSSFCRCRAVNTILHFALDSIISLVQHQAEISFVLEITNCKLVNPLYNLFHISAMFCCFCDFRILISPF